MLLLLLLLPLVSKSQSLVDCDFDYGENCLPGLRTASFVLLNESTVDDDPPRQPPSDVSAIGIDSLSSLLTVDGLLLLSQSYSTTMENVLSPFSLARSRCISV